MFFSLYRSQAPANNPGFQEEYTLSSSYLPSAMGNSSINLHIYHCVKFLILRIMGVQMLYYDYLYQN